MDHSQPHSPPEAELVAARETRLAEMRALTMAQRLSRFRRLCIESAKVTPVKR